MVVVVVMVMRMVMVMRRVMVQQPGADQVHGQAQYGDPAGLQEPDRLRMQQPLGGLVGDQRSDNRQRDGAGEPGQLANLAGAERKPWVRSIPGRIAVRQSGDAERRGMGRHVPAVGHHRHRPVDRAAHDLGDHHHCRDDHYPLGTAGVLAWRRQP
jgi:hypothetical protein